VAGGGITWSLTLAYNTKVYPGNSGPKSWADFFNLDKFPGPRALRGKIGDGAQLQIMRLARNPELLKTEAGRKSLQQIPKNVIDDDFDWFTKWRKKAGSNIIFWEQGSQPIEMLIAGDVNMTSAWNGRILDAAKEGAPIKNCWEGGFFVGTGGWVIPKGLKEKHPDRYLLANLIAAWISFPQTNVLAQKYISFGPTNKKSPQYMKGPEYDPYRDQLPTSTANLPYAVFFDEKWMGDMEDYAEEKLLKATQ
jgi:putative spermidine/putrescine transport system substrate-binding protein